MDKKDSKNNKIFKDVNNRIYGVYEYANKIDDNLIKEITSFKNIELNERIKIFKLYKFYSKFSDKDYSTLEKNIYSKFNINDKLSIIKFEIDRMYLYINDNYITNNEYNMRCFLIKGTYSLMLNDILSNISISDDRYNNLLERIALLEFDMGMKLCLYDEITKILCDKVINVSEYKKELNSVDNPNVTITKKKD